MTTPPAQPRRSPWRKIILGGLVLGVLAVALAVGTLLWTSSKIERIPDEDLTALVEVDGPRNILIVGTDSRENLPDDFEGNFGKFEGARTEVIMLVHYIPGERAQILSLPRDLKVEIEGHGTNKINAAYTFGGPELLVKTVIDNLEVDVNNYVEIDFAGFANLVDAIGGVELEFPRPARDLKSGLDVAAGVQRLDGAQALAFARSRRYEEKRDGEWVRSGDNDIARTRRQQKVLLALFDQATSPSRALNLPSFAATVADQIKADESLSASVLLELGRSAISLSSSDLEAMTLPVEIATIDGTSYVIAIEPDTDEVLRAFRAGFPLPTS